jgi:hypothetical protein
MRHAKTCERTSGGSTQPFALTQFDTPNLVISPDLERSEMDVSSPHAVLTMKTVRGSIWMIDNVER